MTNTMTKWQKVHLTLAFSCMIASVGTAVTLGSADWFSDTHGANVFTIIAIVLSQMTALSVVLEFVHRKSEGEW